MRKIDICKKTISNLLIDFDIRDLNNKKLTINVTILEYLSIIGFTISYFESFVSFEYKT